MVTKTSSSAPVVAGVSISFEMPFVGRLRVRRFSLRTIFPISVAGGAAPFVKKWAGSTSRASQRLRNERMDGDDTPRSIWLSMEIERHERSATCWRDNFLALRAALI